LDKGNIDISEQQWSAVDLVNNPSTCYHCYAAYRDSILPENTAITAITKCHRFEAANHQDFGRLLEFSLREVIFLGKPDYVRSTREQCLNMVETLAEEWALYGELVQANDPFFTNDFSAKAGHQQRMAMKYEYRMNIPGQDKKLSILSSNVHGVSFSKTFNIKHTRSPLHTGCLGFGIERMALAIVAQHGLEAKDWPNSLATRFNEWSSDRN